MIEVVIGEGKTEERVVEIGSSDAMRTEILSGLEEGEKVLVESRAAQSLRQFQMMPGMMPGMGGGRPR